jgi:hypothetical protein
LYGKWFKSPFCSNPSGCVEVKFAANGDVFVRSDADPLSQTALFTMAEWNDFIQGVKTGDFDPPDPVVQDQLPL